MARNINLSLVFYCPSYPGGITQELLKIGGSFNKAKKVACVDSGIERTILSLLSHERFDELPVAVLGSMAESLNVGQGYWLRADPTHIQVTHNAAYYMGYHDLNLKSAEINSLLEAINIFLAQDNMQLYAPQAEQWYLHCQQKPDIFTRAPSEVIGHNIHEYLPKGMAHHRWHHLFTELQMLLYQHPVNVARRSQRQLEINSLWFWGCGLLPEKKVGQHWDKVWTDLPWTQGLIDYLNITSGDSCADISSCLEQIDSPGDYLIIKYLSVEQLQQCLPQWCVPALEWTCRKRKNHLTIYPGDGNFYSLKNKWFF